MQSYKIALVDDDIKLGQLVKEYLSRNSHSVEYFSSPLHILNKMEHESYDLAILDIMMPELNGYELCKKIRLFSDIPILFLSAKSDSIDKILGLELGADDYLSKPFEPRELLARIESILRRTKNKEKSFNDSNIGLSLNSQSFEARLYGNDLKLTSNEFLALNYLVENSNKVVSRDELLSFIQGHDSEVFGRAIDILVARIRQKLGDDPKNPQFIRTIRSQGYRFIKGAL